MIALSVPDMSCGHCKASVEAALSPILGQFSIDLPNRQVQVPETGVDAAIEALAEIGFSAMKAS